MHGVFIDMTSAAPWANYPETVERLRVAAANGVFAERSEWIRFSTECRSVLRFPSRAGLRLGERMDT